MPEETIPAFEQAFGALRQFTRGRTAKPRFAEYCELCSAGLVSDHPHLVELASRRIVCACDACALLFDRSENSRPEKSSPDKARYKRVSRRTLSLSNFAMSDGQWESLLIPISMAFFFRSSLENRMIALYPSPAGAIESLLPLEAWNDIAERNPSLLSLQSDIEALLVNRVGHAQGISRADYFIAPIDECYKLVGLIRASWKGFSGGAEVWVQIGRFFAELRAKADVIDGGPHA